MDMFYDPWIIQWCSCTEEAKPTPFLQRGLCCWGSGLPLGTSGTNVRGTAARVGSFIVVAWRDHKLLRASGHRIVWFPHELLPGSRPELVFPPETQGIQVRTDSHGKTQPHYGQGAWQRCASSCVTTPGKAYHSDLGILKGPPSFPGIPGTTFP